MMYQIAIIDHVGNKAGMDYYSSSLAKGFIKQNIKCTVYSNFIGIESQKVSYKPYYDGHNNKNALLKMFNLVSATIKSSYNARKQKVDLIVLHLFSANIITLLLVIIPKIFGLKITLISHDISSFINNDNVFIQNILYNILADYVIVHNNFSYNELLKHVKLTNPKKVTIIKHGGYLDHIGNRPGKTDIRKSLNLDINGKYILFFGQIKDVKGLDILLEALSRTPEDIKLIIAGKPWKSDFNKYDAIIQKYNLEKRIVKMIRFIEDDEREKLFFAADVNVLPYRIIYQSGVLLMAMSHELPVIASDLPANKEIIRNNVNGMLFESENANDLAKKIVDFFNDPVLKKTISKESLVTIEKEYAWNTIAKQYINLINENK